MSSRFVEPHEWLQNRLIAMGLSQSQLAREIDIDRSRLNKWLKGKETITNEYLALLAMPLKLSADEIAELLDLLSISHWQKRLRKLATKPLFSVQEACGPNLLDYMLDYVDRLVSKDIALEPERAASSHYLKHLVSMHTVLQSAARATEAKGSLLFSAENIVAHIRYPTNHYLARLLSYPTETAVGKSQLSEELVEHVVGAFETSSGTDFRNRLIRKHSAHLRVRLGLDDGAALAFTKLSSSDDVEDQRMVLTGRALSRGATEKDWNTAFDRLQDPAYRKATAVFDVVHFDGIPVDKDWPGDVRARHRSVVESLNGLLEANENRRTFFGFRLISLLEESSRENLGHSAVKRQMARVRALRADKYLPSSIRMALDQLEDDREELDVDSAANEAKRR